MFIRRGICADGAGEECSPSNGRCKKYREAKYRDTKYCVSTEIMLIKFTVHQHKFIVEI